MSSHFNQLAKIYSQELQEKMKLEEKTIQAIKNKKPQTLTSEHRSNRIDDFQKKIINSNKEDLKARILIENRIIQSYNELNGITQVEPSRLDNQIHQYKPQREFDTSKKDRETEQQYFERIYA